MFNHIYFGKFKKGFNMTYTPLVPDFDSVVVEEVVLPYRSEPYLKFSFSDPLLAGYEVTVIEDSIAGAEKKTEGNRLLTAISRFPRCVLAEVNTHRVFGRNSASSRARSVKSTIGDVMNQPYIPLFTKNQKGMSGLFLNAEDYSRAKQRWIDARDAAVDAELRLLMGEMISDEGNVAYKYAELLDEYYESVYNSETPDKLAISVHKQDANRIIEPFMWHEAIITSSYWDNFLELRTDLATAQPAIVAMAILFREALSVSVPSETWLHLPFIAPEDRPDSFDKFADVRSVMMRSSTECAQISYQDKSRMARATATSAAGENLLALKHLSPFEHIAIARETYLASSDGTLPKHDGALVSNLDSTWVQLRKILSS